MLFGGSRLIKFTDWLRLPDAWFDDGATELSPLCSVIMVGILGVEFVIL